jgi:hypothetical protein
LYIISHFSHHKKVGKGNSEQVNTSTSSVSLVPMTVDLLCTFKKNPMIFLRTAYKLHSDHIEAILWKVWLIFGPIWYIYTFHISAIRFSVRSNYPLVGKNFAVAPCTLYIITMVQWWWKPFSFIFNRGNREKSQGAKSSD